MEFVVSSEYCETGESAVRVLKQSLVIWHAGGQDR